MSTEPDQRVPMFRPDDHLPLMGTIERVLKSNHYILGAELKCFEKEFAKYCGVSDCVGVANGTDALELGLKAVGIQPGDQVALQANAGFYGSTATRLVGALPYYVDIDPCSNTMDPDRLLEALEKSDVKAVIVTHLYGQLADMSRIVDITSRAGVALLEDCAQAHGATRDGRAAGSWGQIGCFSFYPTKNLGALGDAGALTTSDPELATRARALRQYGWKSKYSIDVPGGRNSRMDELQAAVLRDKLPLLQEQNNKRRQVAVRYSEAFASLGYQLPPSTGSDYVAHLYVIRCRQRDQLREFLGARGIATEVHYPCPDYRQPAYSKVVEASPLAHTEAACNSILTLPCFPNLREDEVDSVVRAVCDFASEKDCRPPVCTRK